MGIPASQSHARPTTSGVPESSIFSYFFLESRPGPMFFNFWRSKYGVSCLHVLGIVVVRPDFGKRNCYLNQALNKDYGE